MKEQAMKRETMTLSATALTAVIGAFPMSGVIPFQKG